PAPKDGEVPAGWKEYAPPGGRCSVMLPPGEVKQQTQEQPNPVVGKLTINIHGIDRAAQGAFVLAFTDFRPGALQAAKPGALRDLGLSGGLAQLPGSKVTAQRDIKLDNHPGREVTLEVPGKGAMRARAYLVSNRLYMVAAAGPGGIASSADADRFLGSLKLQGDYAVRPA